VALWTLFSTVCTAPLAATGWHGLFVFAVAAGLAHYPITFLGRAVLLEVDNQLKAEQE